MVYEQYQELKSILPLNFMKMKVHRNKIDKGLKKSPSLLMQIEKNKYKLRKNSPLEKDIIITNDSNVMRMLQNFSYRNSSIPQTRRSSSIKKETTEINNSNGYHHGNINSNPFNYWKSVNDSNLKKNIFLPKIIDRLKYTIPRNERDSKGVVLHGEKVPQEVIDEQSDYKKLHKQYSMKKVKNNYRLIYI